MSVSLYPKMLTTTLANGKVVPVVHPPTHPTKGGQHVIFHSKDEEKEYDGFSGIPLTGPEQQPQQQPQYPHGVPWWVKQEYQK